MIIEKLSRRDRQILTLAYEISVSLGNPGEIPGDLLEQIFSYFVCTNPLHARIELQKSGLLQPLNDGRTTRVVNINLCRIRTVFGEEPLPIQPGQTKKIITNWRRGKPIFANDLVDEDPDILPITPIRTDRAKRLKCKAVLRRVNLPQILVDIDFVTRQQDKEGLRVTTVDHLIERHISDEDTLPMRLRIALKEEGYLDAFMRERKRGYRWFVTAKGRRLIETELAEPSIDR